MGANCRVTSPQATSLPILFATGFVDRAGLAGIDEAYILRKPFNDEDLADKLTRVLTGSV